ncbi:putative N-acetyl-gamma-glutamyl-phosphate reductase [Actinidia rufa]|uniref:Putative N-acetyl-gamma-glutamyl-phosphate reductase n=1 Tax=Actinidia rufa TaxID=165716 RepID=A0A7J0D8J4_9ERIC|nr:putative N-acetyl-gamma-glutamyl-phosphate reductase [Actinidia rufa]
MIAVNDADFSNVDAVFCCLPHGTTQEIIKALPKGLKIVDLSADFRLRDINEYEKWYGQPHRAAELQLPLAPLIKVRFEFKSSSLGLLNVVFSLITLNALFLSHFPPACRLTSLKVKNIIIDSKSGVSGAGRGAKEANLYTEIAEGIHSYSVTGHRHVPEIEQGLSEAANSEVIISFTPHLMPMSRGMQSTIYVELAPGVSVEDLHQHLGTFYKNEEFVVLLKEKVPHTRHVHVDNLVKGASGQALQNLNLMMGIPECFSDLAPHKTARKHPRYLASSTSDSTSHRSVCTSTEVPAPSHRGALPPTGRSPPLIKSRAKETRFGVAAPFAVQLLKIDLVPSSELLSGHPTLIAPLVSSQTSVHISKHLPALLYRSGSSRYHYGSLKYPCACFAYLCATVASLVHSSC